MYELNSYISQNIIGAADESISLKTHSQFNKTLPSHILELIFKRRIVKKHLNKIKTSENKVEYNNITYQIRKNIYQFKSAEWQKFMNSLGPSACSSKPFWKKINKINTGRNHSKFADLKVNGITIKNSREKANFFGENLEKIFSGASNKNFDE